MKTETMKTRTLKKLITLVLAFAMIIPVVSSKTIIARANDFDTAKEVSLGEKVQEVTNSAVWYKLEIPKDIRNQSIRIVLINKPDSVYALRMDFYDEDGIQIGDDVVGSVYQNQSGFVNVNISSSTAASGFTFLKGHTYYLKVRTYNSGTRNYDLKITGDYKKATKLSTVVRKGNKKIFVETEKDAKVIISINDYIIKNGGSKVRKATKTATNGTATFKLSRRLKKGDKVTIIVKKSGYETRKITKRII